jgi:hypothetical protein
VVVDGGVKEAETARFWANNRVPPVNINVNGAPYIFVDDAVIHLFGTNFKINKIL